MSDSVDTWIRGLRVCLIVGFGLLLVAGGFAILAIPLIIVNEIGIAVGVHVPTAVFWFYLYLMFPLGLVVFGPYLIGRFEEESK